MSQLDLATALGRTQGWVSKVETNRVEIDSVSLLNALASTLGAHPNEITGRPFHGQNPADERGYTLVPQLTRELRRADLPAEGEHFRPFSELEGDLALLTRQRGQARYTQMAATATSLLAELHLAYERTEGHEQQRAYSLFALACKEVHSLAYGLGFPELVAFAQMRTKWAAQRSGNPHLEGVADYLAARDLWTTNDYGDAMLLLDHAAASVQASAERGDPASASLFGAIQLRAAVTAARANNADEAYTRLDLADEAARWEAPSDPYTLWWSTGNIGVHRVGIAVELCDGVEAVRRAQGFAIPRELPKSRIGHFFLDASRGYVWLGELDRALAALERAERMAPELVRNHPMAQGTVRQMLRLDRASTRERLRMIAHRCNVE